ALTEPSTIQACMEISHAQDRLPLAVSVGSEDRLDLTGSIKDQDVAGGRGGPPPAESGVQGQAHQHSGGENAVDERYPPFGAQRRVVQGSTGAGLGGGQREHYRRGAPGP